MSGTYSWTTLVTINWSRKIIQWLSCYIVASFFHDRVTYHIAPCTQLLNDQELSVVVTYLNIGARFYADDWSTMSKEWDFLRLQYDFMIRMHITMGLHRILYKNCDESFLCEGEYSERLALSK